MVVGTDRAIKALEHGSTVVSLSNTFDAAFIAFSRRWPTPTPYQKQILSRLAELTKRLRSIEGNGTISLALRADVERFINHHRQLDLNDPLTCVRTDLWCGQHLLETYWLRTRQKLDTINKNYHIGKMAAAGRCLWV